MRKLSGKDVELNSISSDKVFFFNRNVLMFCLFLQENLLWVLLSFASAKHFEQVPATIFCGEKRKVYNLSEGMKSQAYIRVQSNLSNCKCKGLQEFLQIIGSSMFRNW